MKPSEDDFVTFDPFEARARKKAEEATQPPPANSAEIPQLAPAPPPVENAYEPRTEARNLVQEPRSIETYEPEEPRKIAFYEPENPRNLGKEYKLTKQLNVEIDRGKRLWLKEFAARNDMTLIQAVELAITLLESYEDSNLQNLGSYLPRNLGRTYNEHDLEEDLQEEEKNHLLRVKTLHNALTGQKWTKHDQAQWKRIRQLPIERVEADMRYYNNKAGKPVDRFAYFVTCIFNKGKPTKQGREALRKQYQSILSEIDYVGSNESESEKFNRFRERVIAKTGKWDKDTGTNVWHRE